MTGEDPRDLDGGSTFQGDVENQRTARAESIKPDRPDEQVVCGDRRSAYRSFGRMKRAASLPPLGRGSGESEALRLLLLDQVTLVVQALDLGLLADAHDHVLLRLAAEIGGDLLAHFVEARHRLACAFPRP